MSEPILLTPYKMVGRNLKARRLSCGLSTRDVAAALRIEVETIEAYENGVRRVSAEHLFEMASVFDVTIGYLFSAITVDAAFISEVPRRSRSDSTG